jgi:hypothetical protein
MFTNVIIMLDKQSFTQSERYFLACQNHFLSSGRYLPTCPFYVTLSFCNVIVVMILYIRKKVLWIDLFPINDA